MAHITFNLRFSNDETTVNSPYGGGAVTLDVR